MLYPSNLEQKINFIKIKELLKVECTSLLGMQYVDRLAFSSDFNLVTKLLDQTEEFRQILISGELFPSSNFTNLNPYLEKAKLENSFLDVEDFYEIKLSLDTLRSCISFFQKRGEDYPVLSQLLGLLMDLDMSLLKSIELIIDEKGKMRSNASKDLQLIRSQIIYEEGRLRKVMDRVFKEARAKGLTTEDSAITVRSGRLVIPIAAENKRKLRGFIHDESATGQTVFMEPEEALDINNEIRDLEYMERREIIKILTQLTDRIRPAIPALRKATNFLGLMDFIRAKAKFAQKTDSCRPEITKERQLTWTKARHPILDIALKSQGKKIVPLDVKLSGHERLLVISGPNAGGKSVTLKTVALLQYMLQCGILIPVHPDSKSSLFDNFFIDIGDEQNLENDLSTYSSHLMSMKHFSLFANKKTILFIDEFGTGTEPQFGGAIAESILLALNKLGAYGVITTHYGNLKQIANKNQGMVNGAMRYDVDKLEPLYQLEIGKPGSSFALEIASKIGIPKEILEYAKGQIGEERVRYDRLLTQVENEKNQYATLLADVKAKERLLKTRLQEYNELKETMESTKKRYLQEAKLEAKQLLDQANKKIESAIREIKEGKAEKEATKLVRKDLEEFKEKVKPEKNIIKSPEIKVLGGKIAIGDWVRVKDNGAIAEVLQLKGNELEISIGELKSKVKLSRLEKISQGEVKKEKKAAISRSGYNTNEKMMDYSPNLDLRGMRGEEILFLIQSFVDEGYMLGLKDLRIVHGKGNGILRDLTRNFLRDMSQVRHMEDEHADRGGAGVTLVTLK
ncbi:DNA mismatch repair protein MutS2 [Algoriphagus ratkowskyi]|uniref:Endonuclease MutS2 n=1 Tax=Algoriphagus ratkowskyi TaxID=57028 RepID=A0A2W7SK14_9BACT|nr:Smr/MutS family protein [Algoriphagus ratkowskyi]PZX51062.1 DNA mismatch repair protein MutS2 [Algoriphagus ratkowskyi]TXD75852.1 endonuclease MutS2 [Algoriphagus ratkowskyi]